MQTANRVAKNTMLLYARMVITLGISLYATRLVLLALGAGDFGVFNVVGGAIAMLTFLNAAMASSSQRFMSYAQGEGNVNKQKNIFNVSVLLHFFIAIAVVLLLEAAGYILFNGVLKIAPERMEAAQLIFQFLIVSTFFTIISVPYDAVINAHENMLFVAILGILESILKLAIAFFITYTAFDKLASYGFLMASLAVLLLVIRRIYCHWKYEEVAIDFRKYFDKPLFKEMTRFAGWSFLGSSSSIVSNYGQGILLNMFFGTVVNAAQGIAAQVSGQLGVFANIMLKALNPVIAKSEGAGNRRLMLKASILGSKVSFFMLLFFYIPVLLEMPLIFKFWLQQVPEFTIVFCRLLLIRNLIEQLFLTLSSSIAAVGNIKTYQIVSSLLNFLPLVVSYVLFSYAYEPYYLYLVFILYAIMKAGVILFFAKRHCGLLMIPFISNTVLRSYVVMGGIMLFSALPMVCMQDGFVRLLCVTGINMCAFACFVWLIGLNKEERIIFSRIFKELSYKMQGAITVKKQR